MATSQQREVVQTEDGPVVAKQVDKAELREKAELYATKNLGKYVKKMHELAMGVTVTRMTKGGPKIYTTEPDRQALQYLIDRVLGKTPDHIEIETDGVQVVIPWAPVIALQPPKDDAVEAEVTVLDEHPEVVQEEVDV